MERVCFLLQVRADRLDEYRARHREVWPEMLAALREAGWGNYSLFLREDGLLVGYVETDDFEAAQRAMAATDVNDRWQRDMAPVLRRAGRPCARAPGGGLPPCLTRRASPPRISVRRADASSSEHSTTGASSSRSSIASPTGRCGCPDGLHWNVAALLDGIVDGLRGRGPRRRRRRRRLGGRLRPASTTVAVLSACRITTATRAPPTWWTARSRASPRDELYAATGIQTLAINTVFQLLADEGTASLDAAARMLLIPDLLAFWLSGEAANEITAASTTGLLDARAGAWAAQRDRAPRAARAPVRRAGRARDGARTAAHCARCRRCPARARRRRSRHRVGLRGRARRR